jgi:hypothetical protein
MNSFGIIDNSAKYITNFSEDFRNEISSNILEEIDNATINSYFGNMDFFELEYTNALKIVEREKFNSLEVVWYLFDNIIEKATKNLYIHIFQEFAKLRYFTFCQIVSTKNPLLTFDNPFFSEKALEMQLFDIKLLETMKK